MLYFFYGEDDFSLSEELRRLREEFSRQNPRTSIEELKLSEDADDRTIRSKLQEFLESQGLFAGKKLVILREFVNLVDEFPLSQKYLTRALEALPAGIDAVFTEIGKISNQAKLMSLLKKQKARVREFVIPRGSALGAWVGKYLADAGFSMTVTALKTFVTRLGGNFNLWRVKTELDKLMLLAWEKKTIDEDNIRAIVPQNFDFIVFDLTNFLAEGRVREALTVLSHLLDFATATEQKSETLKIIGALASQIRSLLLVKETEDLPEAEAARDLGWKEARVRINRRLSKKFRREQLMKLLRDLRAIDLRLKTSDEPEKLLLALFMQKATAATRVSQSQ